MPKLPKLSPNNKSGDNRYKNVGVVYQGKQVEVGYKAKSAELSNKSSKKEIAREILQSAIADELTQREAEESEQIDCFLDTVPHDSIKSMIYYLITQFEGFTQNLKRNWLSRSEEDSASAAEGEIPSELQNMVPVLLISLHGGLPVLRVLSNEETVYDYKTFTAKSEFYRLIKTPNGCCSLILPDVRQYYFDAVTNILKPPFVINQDFIGEVITSVREQLFNLSFDLQKECLKPEDIIFPRKSIYNCRRQAFETVHTVKGDNVINKLWTTDVYKKNDEKNSRKGDQGHQLAPRGILFCNTVVITLPKWTTIAQYNMTSFLGMPADNSGSYTFNQNTYNIGIINTSRTQIMYIAGTNLLSCPYFMQFASELLGNNIITLNNSLSLGKDNIQLIPMVTQITAQVLYLFLCKQKFLSIDMSCESLMFYNKDGTCVPFTTTAELKTTKLRSQLQKLYNLLKKGVKRMRGGNCKTRCNPKKYKTKKYKKHGNTKKNKRYNTKTKKHRK